jgi:uncharacterized protein
MKIKLLIVTVLVLFLSSPLFARPHVADNAGLLSEGEIAELEKRAEAVAANYNFDLVIVTEKDIGGASFMNYADDFFDDNGYGPDGCLLLHVTGDRDYLFSTSGRCDNILNDAAFNKLDSIVISYLRNDDPAGAYSAFIDTWGTFLALDAQGRTYTFFYQYNIILVVIAWVLALAIGLFVVLTWKKQMNTALAKEQADNFIIPGSLAFTQQTDRFLYSTVTKTAKPKSQSASSGSGRSHVSSSGRSHGGRGGKY